MKRKTWFLVLGALVLAGAGFFAVSRARAAKATGTEAAPFRLGKVQLSELQVSVREVGVVDPVAKVDVKSPVSGRVIASTCAKAPRLKSVISSRKSNRTSTKPNRSPRSTAG